MEPMASLLNPQPQVLLFECLTHPFDTSDWWHIVTEAEAEGIQVLGQPEQFCQTLRQNTVEEEKAGATGPWQQAQGSVIWLQTSLVMRYMILLLVYRIMFSLFLFQILFIYLYVCDGVQRSEDNLPKLVPSFYYVGSGNVSSNHQGQWCQLFSC